MICIFDFENINSHRAAKRNLSCSLLALVFIVIASHNLIMGLMGLGPRGKLLNCSFLLNNRYSGEIVFGEKCCLGLHWRRLATERGTPFIECSLILLAT